LFETYIQEPVFADKLNYLLSDMNTHPVHGLHYLRAMLIDYYLQRDNRRPQEALSAQASQEIRDWAGRLIKAGGFSGPQQRQLAAFFAGSYDDALGGELVSLLQKFYDTDRKHLGQVPPQQ
jgi:hypothetical protein